LRGPALTTGSGEDAEFEALRLAWDLIALKDVAAALVVVADVVGEASQAAFSARRGAQPAHGANAFWLSRDPVGLEMKRPRSKPEPEDAQ
jgi:hypothetical protein